VSFSTPTPARSDTGARDLFETAGFAVDSVATDDGDGDDADTGDDWIAVTAHSPESP